MNVKNKIREYEAYFFDFDGVIADSVDIKTKAFAQMYSKYGDSVVKYVVNHHESHGGMSRFLKIRHYHKELLGEDLSEDKLKALTDQFSELVFARVVEAPFMEGVISFLDILKNDNKKMFIISGTPEKEIIEIVQSKKLSDYFLEVKGSPVKKKENLEYLFNRYSLMAKDAIFFGDSPEDLEASSSLGIEFVPINYSEDEINGYKDFSALLKGNNQRGQ